MGMRAVLLAMCLSTPALAEPLYQRVVGVAANDTLNIRSAPSADSADIGDLAYDATAIEVTGFDETGDWARIAMGEIDGWVATRFLASDVVTTIAGTSVPEGLICGGTEPFWALGLYGSDARYSHPEDGDSDFTFDSAVVAQGRLGSPALITLAKPRNKVIEATLTGAVCYDGMSDRTYGWSITMQMIAPGQRRFLSGCCALPRD